MRAFKKVVRLIKPLTSGAAKKPQRRSFRPSLQALEAREFLAAGITVNTAIDGITRVEVTGTESADAVTVKLNPGASAAPTDDKLVVTANLGGTAYQKVVPLWKSVDGTLTQQNLRVKFRGLGGNDTFSNQTNIEAWAWGGKDNDKLFGGFGRDVIMGEGGDDIIYGGTGDDKLYGDHHYTWNGEPALGVLNAPMWEEAKLDQGRDIIEGAEGDDWIEGGGKDDELIGGKGEDVIKGGGFFGGAVGLDGIDEINGGAGDDTLFGDAGNDIMHGGTEHDYVNGGKGSDQLFGEAGNDEVVGGGSREELGDDYLEGGAGDDVLAGYGGNDIIHGGPDNDQLYGFAGNDTLYGEGGDDYIWGEWWCPWYDGTGNDTIYGGEGDDFISGGLGSDKMYGQAGNDDIFAEYYEGGSAADKDQLFGGDGVDYLVGGKGNDYLSGGAWDEDVDTMIGGQGGDSFVSEPASGAFPGDEVLFFDASQGDKYVIFL
jgi:Ca2+-binding RTX toxin-like protein